MAETTFSVKYDGPALQGGRMPVRDLAPALLSLGDLFVEASLVLYPERDPVALDIKATNDGSFEVDLIMHSAGIHWDQIDNFAGSGTATALFLLKDIIIGGSVDMSLFGLIKWLRGRRIEAEEPSPVDPAQVRITVGGNSVDVPADVARLNGNLRVMHKAREVVQPVTRSGIDSVAFIESETEVDIKLGPEHVPPPLESATESESLSEQEVVAVLAILNAAFKEDNKWRFHDGSSDFFAPILDEEFLRLIRTRERTVGSGDRIRCRLQVIQTDDVDGELRLDRRVLEVLEYIPGPHQPELEH